MSVLSTSVRSPDMLGISYLEHEKFPRCIENHSVDKLLDGCNFDYPTDSYLINI